MQSFLCALRSALLSSEGQSRPVMFIFRPAHGSSSSCFLRCRRFSVLKGGFPESKVADPSKPSVSKVIKEMLQNQTSAIGAEATPTKRVIDSDSRTMPTHLPRSYLPRASAGPVPAADLNRQGAAFRGFGREQRTAPEPERAWRPPGWKEGHGQTAEKAPEAEYQRPAIEVWGMRAVVFLVIAALYVEFKDASISPTGHITRKKRPQRHLTEEEEKELQTQSESKK